MFRKLKKSFTGSFLFIFSMVSTLFAVSADRSTKETNDSFVEKAFADVAGEYDPGCCGSSGCCGCGSSSE